MGRIAESETTNWLSPFMISASDVKSLRSSLCFNIESARHPSVKYWMAWISWTPSHEFFSDPPRQVISEGLVVALHTHCELPREMRSIICACEIVHKSILEVFPI